MAKKRKAKKTKKKTKKTKIKRKQAAKKLAKKRKTTKRSTANAGFPTTDLLDEAEREGSVSVDPSVGEREL
jgi:hypothetical protein